MAHRVVILLGLSLVISVWVVTGKEDSEVNIVSSPEPSSTPAAIEEVKDLANGTLQTDPVEGNGNEGNFASLIDRSSYSHHVTYDKHLHHHHHQGPVYHGFWNKKLIWRPRWVKTWQEKKVYVAVWKRMWGPAMINEWVPIPKPPPGWVKHNLGNLAIKTHRY